MQGWWHTWRGAALAAAMVLGGFCLLLVNGKLWDLWGVQHMRPYFLDLVAVLAAGEAHVRGIDVYAGNPLDPLGRPHVYGPAWLLTGSLGLTGDDAGWLGAVLSAVFIATACLIAAPRTRGAVVLTVLALLSPPVVLGLERGNNDLVVFLLLALAAACAAARPGLAAWGTAAVVVVAAALKFYPLAGLATLAGARDSWRRIILPAVTGAAAFGLHWMAQADEIARVLSLTPNPATIFAHGLGVIHITWTLLSAVRGWLLFGALTAGLLGLAWLWWRRRDLAALLPQDDFATTAWLAGASAWLACFVISASFPYRVVLLLLLLPALLRADAPRAGLEFAALLAGTFWLTAPKFWLAHAAEADPANTTALHLLSVIAGADQTLFLLIALTLLWVTGAWAGRRWATERQGRNVTGPVSAR